MSGNGAGSANGRGNGRRASRDVAVSDLVLTGDVIASPEMTLPRGRLARFWRALRDYADLRHTPYGLRPALILGLVIFFFQFDSRAFRIAGPVIAEKLEIAITDVINIQVMVAVVAVFATIGVGYAADRTRRLPYLGVGTFMSGVFAAVMGRANSFAGVAAPRVFDDVSGAAANVPAFSLLADYYPPNSRGRVFALIGTLSRVGRVVGIFAAGLLLVRFGFRTTFLLVGIPLMIMGTVVMIFLREPVRGFMERKAMGADDESASREEEPMSLGESWRTTFGVRTIRRLVVASSIGLVGDAVAGLFFPFFLFDVYGLNEWEMSLALLPAAVAALIGGIYGGGLIDRFTRRNPSRVLVVVASYSIISATGVLLYAFRPPLVVLIAANAVFDFGGALIGPARNVIIANVIPPSIRTTGLQITALSELPGLIFASTLGGALFVRYGYGSVFLFAFPFLVVDGIIALTAAGFYDLDMRAANAAALADEEWRRAREAGTAKMLVCRDVGVGYEGVQVLFDVDFDVEEGEIIALLGTNGAGKSTLFRAISGTQQAMAGAIVFDGRDITHMPTHEIAARGVIQMPGGRGVFPELTVMENLELGGWLVDDAEVLRERMAEVFEIFPDLKERSDTPAGLLSGGQQQQLALAQAFLPNPRLLLIDELSLGLAPVVVQDLLERVREIHRRGVTIVVVEQSVNIALQIADKAVFMEKGEVKFAGATKELLSRPDILRAVYVRGTTAGATARGTRGQVGTRTILEIEGLSKAFGGVRAVDDVSFDLREGQTLGLIGPNGAGKTTVFDLVSGFVDADAGTIRFDGTDVTRMTPEARARLGLVRRFQDAALFGSLTVYETLLVALEQHLEVRSTLLNVAGMPQARRAERKIRLRADALIQQFDLGAYRDKFVKELSTGLRRIVDLTCVLATEPRVLLLDEPSTGIAQAESENLAPLLRRAQSESGCSILIIEHDMALISKVADELIALDQGALVTRGTPDDVLSDERVIISYLGGDDVTALV